MTETEKAPDAQDELESQPLLQNKENKEIVDGEGRAEDKKKDVK